MVYGLTDNGFISKPLHVIIEEEKQAFISAFGNDIDTSNDSVAGAYIGNRAIKIAQLWEMLDMLYQAGDSDSATGVHLDRLVNLVNVQREPAKATRVYECMWGNEGTEIISGHLIRMSSGELFELSATVQLNRSSLLGFIFEVDTVGAGTYQFMINGTAINYVATASDTKDTIQDGLFNRLEALLPGVYISNNLTNGKKIRSGIGIVPFALSCDDSKIEIHKLGGLGIYNAQATGPLFVPIGALTEIVSNVSGLDSVVNYATGITGRNAESDTELRINKNRRQRQANANEIAIENRLRSLPGVLFAKVYSNRSMVESNGRPPKSYEAVVVGGVDTEIAQSIFDKGAAGVQAFGSTTVTIFDSEGFPWEIGFSRPENRFIWLKVEIRKNTEEVFPSSWIDLMKTSLDDWGGRNLGVGVDLIYQKLTRPIYDVRGVAFADIKVAATTDLTPPNEGDYQAVNVIISDRQIAVIDRSRIEITEIL